MRLSLVAANNPLATNRWAASMRARLQVYRALAAFRQQENGVAYAAQRDGGEVPA